MAFDKTTDPLEDLKILSLGRTMVGPNFYDVAPRLIAEIERLRRIEAAARVQHEAYGAYPGLVDALKEITHD